uniref:Phospholipase B-like n=1 Tax=Timema poppense TaxID=170557 RepID=A0A7R9HDE1_TIMPO|nr:unnamed protein product [Timema poppensis]
MSALLYTWLKVNVCLAVHLVEGKCVIFLRVEEDGNYSATVYWSTDGGFRIDYWGQGNILEDIPQGAARAYYRPQIDSTGWRKWKLSYWCSCGHLFVSGRGFLHDRTIGSYLHLVIGIESRERRSWHLCSGVYVQQGRGTIVQVGPADPSAIVQVGPADPSAIVQVGRADPSAIVQVGPAEPSVLCRWTLLILVLVCRWAVLILVLLRRWAVLEVESHEDYPDWVQAYSAGLLEGSLSWQLIHWHWVNTVRDYCSGKEHLCKDVRRFIRENFDWVRARAKKHMHRDHYWHQVELFFIQLDGLEIGWRQGVKRSRQEIDIPHEDFL